MSDRKVWKYVLMDAGRTKLPIIAVNARYISEIYLYAPLNNDNIIPWQVEVFNVLFVKEQEKRHVVHCLSCALKLSPSLQGIVCLEEYRLSELQRVYDSFTLHRTQGLAYTQ